VPRKSFYGRNESFVYKVVYSYFEKFSKIPNFDVLQAAVSKQLSEERAGIINAYIDSLKDIDTSLDAVTLLAELTDSVVINTIDGKIEALVEAAENKDIPSIKKIIADIQKDAVVGKNAPVAASGMSFKPENLKSIDCWMPTVNEHTSFGGVVLVSGSSGGGKSVYAMQQSLYSYDQGLDILSLNIELPQTEYQARILSHVSALPFRDINKSDLSDNFINELDTIWRAKFSRPNKFNIRNGRLDAEELVAVIKQEAITGLDVVVLDYIQIVDANDVEEWRMLSRLIKTLQDLSIELGIVILTPIQINSVDTKEKNNKINITTRGSKELEFSCTVWLHIQQTPDEYAEGIARLFTIKARNGKKNTYMLETQFDKMRFNDLGVII